MKHMSSVVLGLLAGVLTASASHAQEDDFGSVTSTISYDELLKSATDSEQRLANYGFFSKLGVDANKARVATKAEITGPVVMPNLGRGDPKKKYEVILQPGHYLRKLKPGAKMGAQGAQVSEAQLNAFIVANVAQYLIDEKVNVLVISADDYDKTGMTTDIFLSIHADASNSDKCPIKPSLAYGSVKNLLGMHSIGFALAQSFGIDYAGFMKDNYTVDEKNYYAFKHMKSRGFTGLLEVGEITCPKVEQQLIDRALLLSKNLGVALKASLDIINEPLTP